MHSTHGVEHSFWESSLETVFLENLQVDIWSDLKPMLEKEISSQKTRQKHSQELVWDVSIQLKELNISFDRAVLQHYFWRICLWTFGALCGFRWKRNIFKYKLNYREAFSDTAMWCVNSTQSVEHFFRKSRFETLFLESASFHLECFEAYGGKGCNFT